MKLRIFILFSFLIHLLLMGLLSLSHRTSVNSIENLAEVQIFTPPISSVSRPLSPPVFKPKLPQISKAAPSPSLESESPKARVNEASAASRSVDSLASRDEAMAPVQVGAVTVPPRVLHKKKIPYPRSAERAGIEGVVDLKIVVDASGRVQQADVIRGPGFGLDEAALAAVKDCLFSPAKMGERQVAVQMIYKYEFRLGNAGEEGVERK